MMKLDWWHEGDLCRIKIGKCQVTAASDCYLQLLKRYEIFVGETSELEFWNGYYNLK